MRKLLGLTLSFSCLLLTGCSSTPVVQGAGNPDPLESYNRGMYRFNDAVMKTVVIPVTKGYDYALPSFARQGIHNFFQNLGTIPDIGNDILQFNFHYMVKDIARLLINTTIGVGGLFDMAAQDGIYAHPQSFGYTLNKWGWKNSTYIELPLLGPNTISSAVGLVPDMYISPINCIHPMWTRYTLTGLNVVQSAANVVPQQQTLTAMSLDPYVALRDAYLQNQAYIADKIEYDGSPPANVTVQHPAAALPTDVGSATVQEVKQKKAKRAVKNQTKKALEQQPLSNSQIQPVPVAQPLVVAPAVSSGS